MIHKKFFVCMTNLSKKILSQSLNTLKLQRKSFSAKSLPNLPKRGSHKPFPLQRIAGKTWWWCLVRDPRRLKRSWM